MTRLVPALGALCLCAGPALCEPQAAALIDATQRPLRAAPVDDLHPMPRGPVVLVFPGTGETALLVIAGGELGADGALQLDGAQRDQAAGRIGLAVAADVPLAFPGIDRLALDLDGDGVSDSLSFCLSGSQAVLSASSGDGAPLWQHVFSFGYDMETTCPED